MIAYVTQQEDGTWCGCLEGNPSDEISHNTKQAVVSRMEVVLRNQGGGDMIIRALGEKNGTVKHIDGK